MSQRGMSMSTRAKLLIAALGLVIVGLISVFAIDPRGAEPELVCVKEGQPFSGCRDSEQNNCPVSDESYAQWSDWDSQGRWTAGLGGILIVGGVAVGVVSMMKRRA